MDIQTMIREADLRVPNAFSNEAKVDWLNEVNHEFFDIVKIPLYYGTTSNDGTTSDFKMPWDLREKNIRKVLAGSTYYRSILYEDITASFNHYHIDVNVDKDIYLKLSPPPPKGKIIVVYDQTSAQPFLASYLAGEPLAPPEYHWIYVLGLCSRIAKAMNDAGLANNYENDYKNNLAVAQQNFSR